MIEDDDPAAGLFRGLRYGVPISLTLWLVIILAVRAGIRRWL